MGSLELEKEYLNNLRNGNRSYVGVLEKLNENDISVISLMGQNLRFHNEITSYNRVLDFYPPDEQKKAIIDYEKIEDLLKTTQHIIFIQADCLCRGQGPLTQDAIFIYNKNRNKLVFSRK